jgi:EAL domain-containing protein (putative c-di-GMP-specific phosphodiesterase class I)
VVSEGVETEAEQAFLQLHGCDMAQGFLYHRPMPAGDFEAWAAGFSAG